MFCAQNAAGSAVDVHSLNEKWMRLGRARTCRAGPPVPGTPSSSLPYDGSSGVSASLSAAPTQVGTRARARHSETPQGSEVGGHLAFSKPLVCLPAFCSPLLAQLSCHYLQEGVPDLKLVSGPSGPPWTHNTLTLLSKVCRDLNKEKESHTAHTCLPTSPRAGASDRISE